MLYIPDPDPLLSSSFFLLSDLVDLFISLSFIVSVSPFTLIFLLAMLAFSPRPGDAADSSESEG